MGDTEISWTHRPGTRGRSWNPVQGCALKSEGCRNCYAMRLAARFAESGWSRGLINLKTGKWNGEARLAMHKLTEPFGWRNPSTVFVNSMSDLFYEGFNDWQIDRVVAVMIICCLRDNEPEHVFQTLTKRADRMRRYFSDPKTQERVARVAGAMMEDGDCWFDLVAFRKEGLVHPRLWWGASVENQAAADERIPELLATPAAVRFLSCEPLLGPLAIRAWLPLDGARSSPVLASESVATYGVDWVIAGCESGPGARPCDVTWLRALRDQCAAAGVPFFLKQASEDKRQSALGPDGPPAISVGFSSKRKAGGVIELPYLDGVQHAAFPKGA